METIRYVGMDAHTEGSAVVALNAQGTAVMEAGLETQASTMPDFVTGLRGTIHGTFEEGAQAAWLSDVLRPHVAAVIVCDQRKNHWLRAGNQADRRDAHTLARLLRAGLVTTVYHGERSTQTLTELVRSSECLVREGTRVRNRLKALYRARAIPCTGDAGSRAAGRQQWLQELTEPGARYRAAYRYQALDSLSRLRDEARTAFITESRKYPEQRLRRGIATLGPGRVAQLIAALGTPHRFRTKRQLWAYSGLAVRAHASAE